LAKYKKMKEHISKKYFEKFGLAPLLIVRSPGRVNIIGEHTDYNEGFVLPAALDMAAYLAIGLRQDSRIELFAMDLNEKFSSDLHNLKPVENISWPNYILGAIAQFLKIGVSFKGMNIVLQSDVPIGAGLSSSAAIESAMIYACNELFKTRLPKIDMVKMAQIAEHEFAGVRCGIMDMFASVMGKKDHVIKLDCKTLNYEYVPFKLEGLKIVLLNTNVKHSLASSKYNTRRIECEQGVAWVKENESHVNSLRDISIDMLDKYVLPKDVLIYKRCLFVVEEINRLIQACEDLKQGNIVALGEKMFATHEGLSKQYEVSCDELDLLIKYVTNNENVLGARMMGGGFGGCTINLVKDDAIEKLITEIAPAYEAATNLPLTYYIASIENGTEIL
jgi:galactokinase